MCHWTDEVSKTLGTMKLKKKNYNTDTESLTQIFLNF